MGGNPETFLVTVVTLVTLVTISTWRITAFKISTCTSRCTVVRAGAVSDTDAKVRLLTVD